MYSEITINLEDVKEFDIKSLMVDKNNDKNTKICIRRNF